MLCRKTHIVLFLEIDKCDINWMVLMVYLYFFVFQVAQSIPKFVAEDFYSEKWGRIKMFHFCMKKHQAYTCMKYDVKKMLEKHFGQLGDLVEQTDIEENMLLDLVHGILEDSMGH